MKTMEETNLNSQNIWKIQKKIMLNSEKVWKLRKKVS